MAKLEESACPLACPVRQGPTVKCSDSSLPGLDRPDRDPPLVCKFPPEKFLDFGTAGPRKLSLELDRAPRIVDGIFGRRMQDRPADDAEKGDGNERGHGLHLHIFSCPQSCRSGWVPKM